MFVRPVRPLAGEVLLKQFGKSFAVIGDNATGSLCPVFRKEVRKKVFQFIATTAGKLFKKVVRPVGTVNFIRVIEKIMRKAIFICPVLFFDGSKRSDYLFDEAILLD